MTVDKFSSCYPGEPEEQSVGPYTMKRGKDNELHPNPDAHKFIRQYFDTKDNGWQENQDSIQSYIQNNSGVNKGTVMGIINVGNDSGNSHAVILDAYYKAQDIYSCYDPTYNKRYDVDVTNVRYATKVMGLKKTQE